MYKEIFTSKYIIVKFDDNKRILHTEYLKETANMTDSDWKSLMHELKELYYNHPPKYIIDDNRFRLYEYPPEMQKWTLNLFAEQWNKSGLKKIAQIVPVEIISKLTQMQIIEMANDNFNLKFGVKVFESFDNALNWINGN